MLRDEFNRLIALFHEAAEGKTLHLEEVFQQSLAFFEHLKEQIVTGSEEDKQEAMKMMTELQTQMTSASQKIVERSGMTEEQLIAYSENPVNFSKEQWDSIQTSREKVARAGHDLAKTVESSGNKDSPPAQPGSKGTPGAAPGRTKRSTERKGKKSQWMRS